MNHMRIKNYPPGVRRHLEYPEVPAYHFLFEQAKLHPHRTALIFMGEKISYHSLCDQIDRFAAALTHRFGIQPGDRVGVMLPNSPQHVIATFGAQRAGAVPVPFNPQYVEREIAFQAADSGIRVLVLLDRLWPRVKAAGGTHACIQTSEADYLPNRLRLLHSHKAGEPQIPIEEATPFLDLLKENSSGYSPPPVNPREDLAVILYTGGTTRTSRGVMLTHFNYVANIMQTKEWSQVAEEQHCTVLVVLPQFHAYGFTPVLGHALATGATCILVPHFDTGAILRLLHQYHPSVFAGVPTMYTALLRHPEFAQHPFRTDYCISAGAPIPVELMRQFESAAGCPVIEAYGLTEASPGTHCNPIYGLRKPGSVGLPYPDTDVRIIDLETGQDVSTGQEGEILIRGPQVMKGYWNQPEDTASVLVDGWLFTGDIGKMDDDGYLYIIDRKKDMIIVSGFKVYPREIEEVLHECPSVLEACVVGAPNEYRGETVKAFLVLKPGVSVPAAEAEVMTYCRQRLADYKQPQELEFVDSLPKTAAGKVLRRALGR